jgi:iron(III) transport system ATP-binding protein
MRVSIENLTAKYGDSTAVRDLSIDVQDGEMLVLLGPSGCGKTTTMRSIVGLEVPSAGTIRIGERVVFDAARGVNVAANKRDVGMVFQSYAIWPHMTVAENVAFPLRMQGKPKQEIRKQVDETLAMVGLDGFQDRNASLLSGGQMQRVAVARSVVGRPRTLLLDEPLSNLDAKLRDQLRFELREIQQRLGITAIYVTHDQNEALALADRIAVMREGEIVQLGTPVELYETPNCVFAAKFMGVENVLEGVVQARSGGGSRVAVEGIPTAIEIPTDIDPGTTVHLCVRAGTLHLAKSFPQSAVNVFPARLTAKTYLGDHTEHEVALPGGPVVRAVVPAKELSASIGDELFVQVPAESIISLLS